jgi:hypothetical protein
MSLRLFHIVFVACSVVLCVFAGFWALQVYLLDSETAMVFATFFAFGSAALLLVYGIKVWKKLKVLNRFGASVMLNLLVLCLFMVLSSQQADACPSCYGDPDSSAAAGLNAAVIFLVGITGGVFTALGAFFLRLRRGIVDNNSETDNHIEAN